MGESELLLATAAGGDLTRGVRVDAAGVWEGWAGGGGGTHASSKSTILIATTCPVSRFVLQDATHGRVEQSVEDRNREGSRWY